MNSNCQRGNKLDLKLKFLSSNHKNLPRKKCIYHSHHFILALFRETQTRLRRWGEGIKKIQIRFEKSKILKTNLTLQHSMKPQLHQTKISQADLGDMKK